MESEFTILENKTIGRTINKLRKLREKKAFEVAEHIGISEAQYTKYERGESKITVEFIQKVAEFLKVDPIQMLSTQPGNFVENVHNSPFAIHGTVNATDDKQIALITKLIETQIEINKKLIAWLENEKK